ncbi:hypothetical protein [Sneathiella sp.]|jgi:hypothetical protein|uniref:hypothetical protein n=1 Tax=Sneathiella sp. TaxID=1964365 RepID=UPI0039E2BF03
MSHNRSVINEQHLVEITYFTSPPPKIVHRAAAVLDKELTGQEYEEAMSFTMKHGQKMEVRSNVSNDQIIEVVEGLGGQGPILVSSIYNYTIEAQHASSPNNVTSDKE